MSNYIWKLYHEGNYCVTKGELKLVQQFIGSSFNTSKLKCVFHVYSFILYKPVQPEHEQLQWNEQAKLTESDM